jgi:hypothetical protein
MRLRSSSRFHSPGTKGEAPATCRRYDDNLIAGITAAGMTGCFNLRANFFNGNALAAIESKQWHAGPSTESTAARDWPKDRLSQAAHRTPGVRQCRSSVCIY